MWFASLRKKAQTESAMRRSPQSCSGFRPSLECLEDRIVLATIRWTNPAGGSWHLAANWDLQRVPAQNDDVIIDLPGNYTVTYSSGTSTITSLDSARAVTLGGGILNVAGQVRVTNTFVLGGDGTLRGATVTTGTTVLAHAGEGTLQDVTLNGDAEVGFIGNERLHLAGAWRNNGTITVASGTLNLGGTFTTAALGRLRRGGGVVNITGTLNNNLGTLVLNAATGSWNLLGGTINVGTVTTTEGTRLHVEGSGRLHGVTLNGSLTVLDTLTVSGGLALYGTMTVGEPNTNRAGRVEFEAAELSGSGTVVMGRSAFNFFGTRPGSGLAIPAGITVRAQAGEISIFLNQGVIEVSGAGPGLILSGARWRNEGVIRLTDGTLTLAGTVRTIDLGTIQRTRGTVNLTGTIENDGGVLDLNATTGSLRLLGGSIQTGVVTGTGGVILIPTDRGGILATTVATDLELTGNSWLRLYGRIRGRLTLTSGTLYLAGVSFTLADLGDFRRTGGSVVLTGILDNTGTTLALNRTTGSWYLLGGTIRGGTVTIADGARLEIDTTASGRLSGVTLNSDYRVERSLRISDGLTLNATLTLGDDAAGQAGQLLFEGSQVLAGTGTVSLGTRQVSRIDVTQGIVTLGPGITVRGSGYVENVFNRGTILVDTPGRSLTLGGNLWQNAGILRLTAGELNLEGTFTTSSIVGIQRSPNTVLNITGILQNAGSTLALNATTGSVRLVGGSIRGGTITAADGATLVLTNLDTNLLDGVILNLDLQVPENSGVRLRGGWRNNGTIRQTGGTIRLLGTFGVAALGRVQWSAGTTWLAGILDNRGTTLALDATTGPWIVESGSILGGTVTTSQGTYLRVEGRDIGNWFSGVTVNGSLEVVGSVNITGGLTLNGTLAVGTPRTLGEVWFDGNQTLAGTATITLLRPGDKLGASYGTVTFGPGISIRATSGQLWNFVNRGPILAENPGGTLYLYGSWRNEGILHVTEVTLNLGGTFTTAALGNLQRKGGTILLFGTLDNRGATLTFDATTGPWVVDGTINGGTIRTLDDIHLLATSFAVLVGVTLEGDLDAFDTGPDIRGGLTLNGTITLGYGDGYGFLGFDGTQTLDGTGTIIFQGSNVSRNAIHVFADDATLTIGPNITIGGGGGRIGASGLIGSPRNLTLDIEGTISADTAGRTILLAAVNIRNRGWFQALNGGNLTLERRQPAGTLSNEGFMVVGMGSTLTANAAYTQADGATFLLGGTLTAPLIDLQGGLLSGSGTINGDVRNGASLFVGLDGSPGRLAIQGNYTQTADGILNLKLGGTTPGTEHDQLAITGTATLDGTLNLTVLDDYFAQPDDTFALLTFAAHDGGFATIEGLYPKGQDVFFVPMFDDTAFRLLAVPY